MTTRNRVLEFCAVAPERAPLVSVAIVTTDEGDVVQCLSGGGGSNIDIWLASVRTAWSLDTS